MDDKTAEGNDDAAAVSRRGFLGTAVAVTAAAGSRRARAADDTASDSAATKTDGANDRVQFAVIGCGGMGTGHLRNLVERGERDNIRVAAVCDVYQRRLTRAREIAGCEGSLDYRPLLERDDIDAVLIATPDHWHAKIAGDALEAGKHVYVEKPMTHTVEQAIELRNTVRRTGKVLQVGPQGTGDDKFWQAHDALRAGRIGKVTWGHGTYNRNARVCLFNDHQKIDPTAGPDKTGEDFIDWQMWLGSEWNLAPQIPWTPEHFFRFRKYWPYNGGVATDLLYHKLAPLLLAIAGPQGEYPWRVNASGGLYIEKDGRDIPDVFLMTVDYPSEFSLFLASTLTNDSSLPDRIYGKFGTLEVDGLALKKNGDFEPEFKERNGGVAECTLSTTARRDMVGNFLDVIRGGGPLHCNVELGAATMVAIKLAVESYRQQKTMIWDPQQEKLVS
ncbi:MAG: Gfo/Idh/MocA family protein [Pirellulales bacterium]